MERSQLQPLLLATSTAQIGVQASRGPGPSSLQVWAVIPDEKKDQHTLANVRDERWEQSGTAATGRPGFLAPQTAKTRGVA